jgi:hypothetical protein
MSEIIETLTSSTGDALQGCQADDLITNLA